MRLPERTRDCLLACAEASLPAGATLPAGGEATVLALEEALDKLPASFPTALATVTRAADLLALRYGRTSLASVSVERRFQLLEAWRTAPSYPVRAGFRMLLAALKAAHYGRRVVAERAPCRLPMAHPVAPEPAPRWMSQVVDLSKQGENEQIEADVVIVGTGAGGAAAARVLAASGLAVVMLEEGAFHTRADFHGSVLARIAKLYSRMGLQATAGNVSIFLPTGSGVGGTTTINAGTCLRAPPWVLQHWREEQSVPLADAEIEPYFEQVERWLEVATAPADTIGMQGVVIARGADKLGIAHGPLPRNAPGCDGQGLCCFGCPTGAKRSADVALVPAALSSGAMLFTGARVEAITHAPGVVRMKARSASGRVVDVQARAGIVAAGALATPLLLGRMGYRHPMLGRNLSIHPAAAAVALFPFDIRMEEAAPQGYGLEGLREQGLLFEGGGTPFELTAVILNQHGPRLVELLEQHHRLLTYGFNVRDTSRGRVVAGPGGRPLPLYNLGRSDVAQLHFGMRTLIDLLVQGGATTVFPPVHGLDEVPARTAGRALEHRRFEASDLDLSAHHPLGTARMGSDPRRSVVDMDLRLRDMPGLLVCDGSVIPTSMGHNPQITIMALASRAAERLAGRLAT